MTMTMKSIMGACAMMASAVAFSGVANAQATAAGTDVQNTFTLDYSVNSVAQDTITNDTTQAGNAGFEVQGTETVFTVDRKVDVDVLATNSPVNSTPNQTEFASFEVTNEGNDNQSYTFSIEDVAGDDFDGTYTVTYYVDSNSNGFADEIAGGGTTVTQVTPGGAAGGNQTVDIAPDETILVHVTQSVPSGQSDGDVDDLVLVAETRQPSAWIVESGASAGATLARDTNGNDVDGNGVDTGAVENVFTDEEGPSTVEAGAGSPGFGTDPDAIHSAAAQFLIASPDLSADKTVEVVWTTPPAAANCATDTVVSGSYSVAGACVEYVITVVNNGATATATNISLQDVLPAEVDFVDAVISGFDAAPAPTLGEPSGAATVCDGLSSTCNVTVSGASLSAGNTATLTIRALVK